MIERFIGPLPAWAKREHPFLRYELRSAGGRRWLLVAGLLGLLLLLAIGVLVATQVFNQPLSPNLTETVNRVLYVPLLVLQVLLMLAAFTMATGAIGDLIRQQRWDNLRATEGGTTLALQTRWAAIFYRLRLLLTLIVGARLLLVLGILWDLTAFQGQYLDLLISGITPQLSIPVSPDLDLGVAAAVLLLSFMLTAGVLLPLTTVAFDAALGLLLSTFVRQRTYSILLQLGVLLVRAVVMVGIGLLTVRFLQGQTQVADGLSFALMAAFGAFVDWGLYFLHLGSFGEVWAVVPFGVLLGVALLLVALAQGFLANRMLLWAIQRAQVKG
jgi:hypothetical protein